MECYCRDYNTVCKCESCEHRFCMNCNGGEIAGCETCDHVYSNECRWRHNHCDGCQEIGCIHCDPDPASIYCVGCSKQYCEGYGYSLTCSKDETVACDNCGRVLGCERCGDRFCRVIAIISRFLTSAGVLTASIVLGINLAATKRFVKEQRKPKMVSSEVEDM